MTCVAPDLCTKCVPGYNTMDGGPCMGKFNRAFHLSAIATVDCYGIFYNKPWSNHICVCVLVEPLITKAEHHIIILISIFFYDIQIYCVDFAYDIKYTIHKNVIFHD